MAQGVNYCVPVKMNHKGFCLDTLEKLMKYWPQGSCLVMTIPPKIPGGRPLMSIVYKYYSRKALCFVATEGGGKY